MSCPTKESTVTSNEFFKNILKGCVSHALAKFPQINVDGIHLGGKAYKSWGDFTAVVIIQKKGAMNMTVKKSRTQ